MGKCYKMLLVKKMKKKRDIEEIWSTEKNRFQNFCSFPQKPRFYITSKLCRRVVVISSRPRRNAEERGVRSSPLARN